MRYFSQLATLADDLDRAGLYREADALLSRILRLSQHLNPQNLNMPIDGVRMYELEDDELERLDDDRKQNPRLIPKDSIVLPGADDADEEKEGNMFSMHNPNGNPVPGPMMIYPDTQSPSIRGDVSDGEWDKRPDDTSKTAIPRWGWG